MFDFLATNVYAAVQNYIQKVSTVRFYHDSTIRDVKKKKNMI